jgi:DNA-binding FrmR family transcriptional regulator
MKSFMNQEAKRKRLNRLGRIKGQVRGVARMIDEDRYCIDIMTQITAARSALQKVEEELLRNHVSHRVEHAITSGNADEQRKKVAERRSRSNAYCRSAHRLSAWRYRVMPIGSPGMEGGKPETYEVVLIDKDGQKPFARFRGSEQLG